MTPVATPKELLGHGDRPEPLGVAVETESVQAAPAA
jgi:hypothetical protein